jgi:hypothetical protein
MKHRYFLLILIGVFLFCGCDEEERRAVESYKTVENLRAQTVAQSNRLPYRTQQHMAFKRYFSYLAHEVQFLRAADDARNAMLRLLKSQNIEVTRRALFISRAQWSEIMKSCVRNGYFVCADEVAAYPKILRAFKTIGLEAE